MDFKHPVPLGAIVTLQAVVTWTGRTSLEVSVDVYSEKARSEKKTRTNTAYLVFVALGYDGNPQEVPEFLPETSEEKLEYERALQRREMCIRDRLERACGLRTWSDGGYWRRDCDQYAVFEYDLLWKRACR